MKHLEKEIKEALEKERRQREKLQDDSAGGEYKEYEIRKPAKGEKGEK